jgi:hypothetical protein
MTTPNTPELTLNDRITIVVALSERAKESRRRARSRKYAGLSQRAIASRAALVSEAADCKRLGKLLAGAWGLGWKDGEPS